MLHWNIKRLLTRLSTGPLSLFGSTIGRFGIAYLLHVKSPITCAYCIAVRFLFLIWVISGPLLARLFSTNHCLYYSIRGMSAISGLLFSLRQLYFEQVGGVKLHCSQVGVNAFAIVWKWLYAGAPACLYTPHWWGFSLSFWAVLIFGGLSLGPLYLIFIQRRN